MVGIARARVLEFGDFTTFFDILGECLASIIWVPRFDGRNCNNVFVSVNLCLYLWTLVNVPIKCICIGVSVYMYTVDTCICIGVTNAYPSVVYFLHLYPACDVPYYCFISCVADPSWSFSLRALYSASGPYQPPGFTLSPGLHHSTVV